MNAYTRWISVFYVSGKKNPTALRQQIAAAKTKLAIEAAERKTTVDSFPLELEMIEAMESGLAKAERFLAKRAR